MRARAWRARDWQGAGAHVASRKSAGPRLSTPVGSAPAAGTGTTERVTLRRHGQGSFSPSWLTHVVLDRSPERASSANAGRQPVSGRSSLGLGSRVVPWSRASHTTAGPVGQTPAAFAADAQAEVAEAEAGEGGEAVDGDAGTTPTMKVAD
jgi:hypothetical protein